MCEYISGNTPNWQYTVHFHTFRYNLYKHILNESTQLHMFFRLRISRVWVHQTWTFLGHSRQTWRFIYWRFRNKIYKQLPISLENRWASPKNRGVSPKMDGLWLKTLLKLMIWGYPYFLETSKFTNSSQFRWKTGFFTQSVSLFHSLFSSSCCKFLSKFHRQKKNKEVSIDLRWNHRIHDLIGTGQNSKNKNKHTKMRHIEVKYPLSPNHHESRNKAKYFWKIN